MVAITCPKCDKTSKHLVTSVLGHIVTPKKTASAIENGMKGGRPKGESLSALKKHMADIKAGRVTVSPNERHSLGRLIRRRLQAKASKEVSGN